MLLDTLADVASNIGSYEGVFILTIKKTETIDLINFASYGKNLSFIESLGIGQLFCDFVRADALTRSDEAEDEVEDELG